MLNKSLKDQESQRIDNILKRLMSIVVVPKVWTFEDLNQVEEQLKDFGLNLESLVEIEANQLILLLDRLHFDWNQKEQFADFLVTLSKENNFDLNEKIIAIYTHIQSESKIFSFVISNKISFMKT
jgi:D-mannonate dehydratase